MGQAEADALRTLPALLVAALALPLAIPAGATHAGAHVDVLNFRFEDESTGQARTVVRAGESVTWTWRSGGVPHSVTSDASLPPGVAFDSGVHAEGSPAFSYTVTFDAPGFYTYECRLHPGMTGLVVVAP